MELRIFLNHLDPGVSPSWIAHLVGQSQGFVYSLRNNPFKLGAESLPGRPGELTSAEEMLALRTSRKGHDTTRSIQQTIDLNLSLSQIHFYLLSGSYLQWKIMLRALPVTSVHHQRLFAWANLHFHGQKLSGIPSILQVRRGLPSMCLRIWHITEQIVAVAREFFKNDTLEKAELWFGKDFVPWCGLNLLYWIQT